VTVLDPSSDPYAQLEAAFVGDLLGDLTEHDIAAMSEQELAQWRARLIAADVRPSVVAR
jgi:hypothetical protein